MVVVDWGDAWSQAGWYKLEEVEAPSMCQTVGFLVQTNKNGITVASRRAYDNQVGAVSFIPKGMIKKITKVKV